MERRLSRLNPYRQNPLTRIPSPAKKAFADLDKLADGMFFTRDLVSEPGNILYPESLAEQARR
jgi:leucyl aminopeptidase